MSNTRVFNFSPGPAMLPLPVLLQVQRELLDWQGHGVSVMELGHRLPEFVEMAAKVRLLLREVLNVPETHEVLFVPGGGRTQFAAVPLNLSKNNKAAYVVSGIWSELAYLEGKKLLTHATIASQEKTLFEHPSQWRIEGADYVHYTDNETVAGLECPFTPDLPIPVVADMSSNLLSRPVPIEKFGCIYAAAQKNIGPAGVTVLIIRRDLIGHAMPQTPSMLNYENYFKNDSMYNTPVTFSWYVIGLVLEWLKAQGGVAAMAKHNEAKAKILYDVIDASSDFYHSKIHKDFRSRMNVCFYTKSPELNEKFVAEATQHQLFYLKGHKTAGGIRASIYNAMPIEGVHTLASFMRDFMARNG